MENTLLPGDKILVCKYRYGPISFRSNLKKLFQSRELNNQRRRISKQKRNDIVVFHSTQNSEDYLIKRLVGLPGENFEINDGIVLCDSQVLDLPPGAQMKYLLWINSFESYSSLLDSLGIHGISYQPAGNQCFTSMLCENEYISIVNDPCIDSMHISTRVVDTIPHAYPYNMLFPWTYESFGPVRIPQRGMKIELTPESYILYKSILVDYEKQDFTVVDNKVHKSGKAVHIYTFQQDYYFMLGDNRYNSSDSREWGFVPEEAIVGKAIMVLFSKGYTGFRRDRFFKTLY